MRVLIADTDETSLEILQSFLWHHDYETEIASDAHECLAMINEYRPHVLVLGTGMLWGGSDGLLALLQEDSGYSNMHLILSGDSLAEFDTVPLQRPVGWLQKPFRLVDLLWRLAVLEAIVDASIDRDVDENAPAELTFNRNEFMFSR